LGYWFLAEEVVMADREIHTSSGGSGVGLLGVILGAVIVIGVIFFAAGGPSWFAKNGGGGSSVTINAPQAPAAPKAPSTTGSR
jgi:hypothetical protein